MMNSKMNTEELLRDIAVTFPPVEKPNGLAISFHKDECLQCEYLREDLNEFDGPVLPAKAIRTIYQEMSCLSAQGWRWVLPSYLTHCVSVETVYDGIETEFLIYNLGPEQQSQDKTLERLSALNFHQIGCLIHFLEWCSAHEHWAAYCAEDIERALSFMRTVQNIRVIAKRTF